MRFTILLALSLCLVAAGAYAGVTINGTTITFDDNTMQTTAKPSDHGGTGNSVTGTDSFIGGGYSNLVTDDYGTIGGGRNNTASGYASTVGGGYDNTASGYDNTVGGGFYNRADGHYSTVGGGGSNTASGDYYSTVGGGGGNTASGTYSTVGGGGKNTASGYASTVGGGGGNTASGDYSFVAGESANDGAYNNVFVWDDGTGSDATAANTFNVNASGGIVLNGFVEHMSDRNKKEAFSFVSAREVLDKVVEMPVSTWRFKSEDDSVRHIGPMAQDFMAAFGYGKSDKHIVSTDADGVALAAIQGLHELHREKDARLAEQAEVNTALRWHNAQLNSRNNALEARLARLEKAILGETTGAD